MDTPPLADWGARIRARRKELGLRQEDLAAKMDVDQATVSSWERGTYMSNDATKVRLAGVLECDPADLFPWSPTPAA